MGAHCHLPTCQSQDASGHIATELILIWFVLKPLIFSSHYTFLVESILRMVPKTDVIWAFVSFNRPTTSRMYTARNQAGLGTGCIGGMGGGDGSCNNPLAAFRWNGSLACMNCSAFAACVSPCCSVTRLLTWVDEFPKVLTRMSVTICWSQEYLNMNCLFDLFSHHNIFNFFQNAVSITTCR